MSLCQAIMTCYCAIVFKALNGSSPLGPHQWNIPLSEFNAPILLNDIIILVILYGAAAIFLKSALLALYLRIFRPAKIARLLIWASILLIVPFYATCFVIDIVVYRQFLNDPNPPDEGYSILQNLLWVTMGIYSVVIDFYLLAVPVGLTLNVRLPLKRKIGVCCMFLTGLLACVFSILATVYRFQLYRSYDVSWLGPLTYAFTAAEMNVGISCSCMPAVPVVFLSLAKTTSWDSFIRVITRRMPNHGNLTPNSSDSAIDIPKEGPPQIPPITRIELKFFMRKAHCPQSRRESRMSIPYDELTLIDEDYHTQLRSLARTLQQS
ncbi:hypothetical protein F4781DRAFT_216680 [Annulohypoxylon bovei var. microspora]|nr:hypothetical protein F4781DRAFT_216680 [Annulohypoxylon bovei var. microspora]